MSGAEPDIAFAWLVGVGVTDRFAYMGDSLNRRLLRAKLVYAAEQICEVKQAGVRAAGFEPATHHGLGSMTMLRILRNRSDPDK